MPRKNLIWSYGITTVPDRYDNYFKRTARSLFEAGFCAPHIFSDGCSNPDMYADTPRCGVTVRSERIGIVGNWMAAIWELYAKCPGANRWAIFQDDFITIKGLRKYLDSQELPRNCYWNLYTFPENEELKPEWMEQGFYPSNQLGRGAVALVFEKKGLLQLLSSTHLAGKPMGTNGKRNIDGAISTAMGKVDVQELVHSPSLCQHIGHTSSLGNKAQPQAISFPEEKGLVESKADETQYPEEVIQLKRTQRIGLVGYNCNTGLGEKNRQLATWCEVDTWLVKPHKKFPTKEGHEDVDTIFCPQGVGSKQIDRFLALTDTVLFDETEYYKGLAVEAKKRGKRVVCIACMEWMPPEGTPWLEAVDLFVCPTKQCYEMYQEELPCVYFPWPVDTDRFRFSQRKECKSFLFLNGGGGWRGRKGLDVILKTLEMFPQLPLKVISQVPIPALSYPNVEVLSPPEENYRLYEQGDILISPHKVDGTGLEQMESMASGLPVINTQGKPWDEVPSYARISSKLSYMKIKRNRIPWREPSAEDLVQICKSALNENIEYESRKCRDWAESRSWSSKGEELTDLIRNGEPK